MLGFNYRMTELEAAIAFEQLKKLDACVEERRGIAEKIIAAFRRYDFLTPPREDPNLRHVYYYLCFRL
ncbi:DegT/DnrJ/EryC1/StrS family aminotransferase, partial [Brachyspira hyodysenteriae]|uniref:DegT/DnrJ/EryC1/StrS family aminotransferase n=1 Tax=Brachyspira hyodysenteriae TaxID=159 RepID=UPI0034D1FE16